VYDLIIVPGGGVRADGTLPLWSKSRFDRVLEIRQNEPILCLSAGTVHKRAPLVEAVAGARYLLDNGLAPESILMENASWDTVGNAFFARTTHTDLRPWRRLLVVNSAFHMERTETIFRWVFGLAPNQGYDLHFDTVPDVGMPEPDLEFRRTRERKSLLRVESLRARISTLSELHEFLFTGHDAYSAAGLLKKRERDERLERVY
jgi:hypothetical protein